MRPISKFVSHQKPTVSYATVTGVLDLTVQPALLREKDPKTNAFTDNIYPIPAKRLATLAAKYRCAQTVDLVCQIVTKETPQGITHRISQVYYAAVRVEGEAIGSALPRSNTNAGAKKS